MTDININTALANRGALDQLQQLTRQTAHLTQLISASYDTYGLDDDFDAETDFFNNFEVAAQILTSAHDVTDEITGPLANSESLGEFQLTLLYTAEYYRLLFGKIGTNDFDRCATITLAERLAQDVQHKLNDLLNAPLEHAA